MASVQPEAIIPYISDFWKKNIVRREHPQNDVTIEFQNFMKCTGSSLILISENLETKFHLPLGSIY